MKTIIDAETGELIETETQNEIATRTLTDLGVVSTEVLDFLEQFRDEQERFETFRYVLKGAMKEHSIKKWENEVCTVSYVPETTKTSFDSERAKEMKLSDFLIILSRMSQEFLENTSVYDYFKKMSYSKDSIRISFKENR